MSEILYYTSALPRQDHTHKNELKKSGSQSFNYISITFFFYFRGIYELL